MTPQISVVIPTRNNSAVLAETLASLLDQTVPGDEYEVIIVGDGCTDDTTETVRALSCQTVRVTLIEQRALGAAAARNRGAAEARAPLLLFLDDDMTGAPSLIEAHLMAHASRPGGLLVGYFPMDDSRVVDDPFAARAKEWWDEQFRLWSDPSHRFTFKDVCAGNLSIGTNLFRAAGGFCEDFPSAAGEDFELGVRLLKSGVRVQFAPDAIAEHRSAVDFAYMIRRQKAAGFSHVLIAERHPELFWSFKLHASSRLQKHPRVWRVLWRYPAIPGGIVRALSVSRTALAWMNARRLMMWVAMIMEGHAYWEGMRTAFGTFEAWQRMMREAPHEPPDCREIDLEVARDWRTLSDRLTMEHVDAIRLFHNGQLIGRIAPVAGAERLSDRYVREYIIDHHSGMVLRLLLDELMAGGYSRAVSGYNVVS